MTRPGDTVPVGRLHSVTTPRYRVDTMEPVYVLEMVARGQPLGPGLDGAVALLDLGHEYIVRGFADLTTRRMHEVWGRRK
jgi:hypothetical protein